MKFMALVLRYYQHNMFARTFPRENVAGPEVYDLGIRTGDLARDYLNGYLNVEHVSVLNSQAVLRNDVTSYDPATDLYITGLETHI